MKTKPIATGLATFFLLQLSACSNGPQLPAVNITENTCVIVTPCQLSPITLTTNNDLLQALIITESDWADCAAQIDAHLKCQQKNENTNGKTAKPKNTPAQ